MRCNGCSRPRTWDPDAVRDALVVRRRLGDAKRILAIDETGFLKKGTASAGVARQYSGTPGRVENCQIGVFLTYASPAGRTSLDRELYLPKAWIEDRARCNRAGVPEERVMATKPALAAKMIERALDAGIQVEWATGDAVYGQHAGLRRRLEARGLHYVMAVTMNQRVITPAPGSFGTEDRADELFAALDGRAWHTRTAGTGTKGERLYAWARIRISGPAETGEPWLLARRSLKDPTDLAYFICFTPENVTLIELATVAGPRWAIEETFQTSKGETGLDHYQVRQNTGWYRHVTHSMFAHAFLSVIRSKKGDPYAGSEQLVRLSLPEIRHLITRIAWHRQPDPHHVLHCSFWRRKHQHRAQQCHYKVRGQTLQTRL